MRFLWSRCDFSNGDDIADFGHGLLHDSQPGFIGLIAPELIGEATKRFSIDLELKNLLICPLMANGFLVPISNPSEFYRHFLSGDPARRPVCHAKHTTVHEGEQRRPLHLRYLRRGGPSLAFPSQLELQYAPSS